MTSHLLKDIYTSTDRYKIYTLICNPNEIAECIEFMQSQYIKPLNIGKELAKYIDSIEDYSYLNIDVYDYIKKLLDKSKSKVRNSINDIVAIYNIGILLEPAIEINAVQLLKEFSKSAALIIIWENQSELPDRLNWPTQKQNFFFDFSDITLKKLHYAI